MSTGEADRLDRIRDLVRTLHELQTLKGDPLAPQAAPSILTEAPLQLAEQQLTVLNALAAHVAMLDAQGVILWVNEAWRSFGQANELQSNAFGVGLNYLSISDAAMNGCAADAAAAADGIRSVLQGQASQFSFEYACHSPTEQRWYRLMVTPVLEGHPGGAVVMHVNVTDRRLAEERLRESLARSSEAERIAHFGSWELSLSDLEHLSNNALTASDELLRIAGVAAPATAAQLARLLPPEARDELRAALRAAIRERQPYSFVHRFTRPDGAQCVLQQRGRCFFDEATGQPLKLVGTAHDITDQARADEGLRQSESAQRVLAIQLEGERAQLWAAQRVAKVGSWEKNFTTLEVVWSEENHRIFETDHKTFHPTHPWFLERVAPRDRAAVEAAFAESRATREPCAIEHSVLLPGGRSKFVEQRWQTFFDETGRAIRAVGTCHDITDRKRADEELRRQNRALRLLSQCNEALVRAQSEQELLEQVCRIAADDGGYLLAWVGYADDDAAKTISVRASKGAKQAYLDGIRLSWSPDVAEGNGPAGQTVRSGKLIACTDITTDTDFALWRGRALAHGIRSAMCFPLRDASRTLGVFCLYAAEASQAGADELRLLQDLADNLAFGVVGLRAREQHRLAEEKLREQAALLDKASEAIFVRELDGRISYWNRGAEQLYGWTAAEIVGHRAAEFFQDTDATQLTKAREQVLTTGAWAGELQKVDKAGRAHLIAARWSLLRDAQGKPRAVLALNADITERRQFETQHLRAQRLESIGTLAGGIAHDLNNVLTPILSSIAMLSDGETNAEKREDLLLLEGAARRGAAMVRQLLAFARGEPQGPHKRLDVAVIAAEVLKMARDSFPKDISAVLQLGQTPWPIRGDSTQIHQLLTNLCVNARDAMPQGGVLTLSLEGVVIDDLYAGMSAKVPPGRYLRVRVEDTGSGMTPEVSDRIFEPFFTTKPLGKGTGLGLSTCHSIARNHGGLILVSTVLGKGSCFEVYLPAASATEALGEPPSPPPQLPRGHDELVLVVDDEEALRKVARRTLERYGYRVLAAANGAEAIALYSANAGAIAVVLTDMSMPVMDGPTTILALKAIDPSVRIIGSTGNDTDGKADKARSLGVTHWLPKPYTADALLRLLRAVIG